MEYFVETIVILLACLMWYINGRRDGFDKGYKKAVNNIQNQHKDNNTFQGSTNL